MRLFKPAVTVTMGLDPGFLFVSNIDGNGLRVAFSVRRTMTSTPDAASITIYNMDEVKRKALEVVMGEFGRAPVWLQVGYDGITKSLFRGDIRTPIHPYVQVGGDIATQVDADDGGDAIAEVALPLPVSGGALTAAEMISAALNAFAIPPPFGAGAVIGQHPSVGLAVAAKVATRSPHKVVSIGKATDLLDEAARILGVRWWIRDSLLHMAQRSIPTDSLAVILPRTHWLTEPTEDGKGYMRLATFMDPTIVPGRVIILVGRVAPGVTEQYRAETCDYTGDTDSGQPWSVDCYLRRLG